MVFSLSAGCCSALATFDFFSAFDFVFVLLPVSAVVDMMTVSKIKLDSSAEADLYLIPITPDRILTNRERIRRPSTAIYALICDAFNPRVVPESISVSPFLTSVSNQYVLTTHGISELGARRRRHAGGCAAERRATHARWQRQPALLGDTDAHSYAQCRSASRVGLEHAASCSHRWNLFTHSGISKLVFACKVACGSGGRPSVIECVAELGPIAFSFVRCIASFCLFSLADLISQERLVRSWRRCTWNTGAKKPSW